METVDRYASLAMELALKWGPKLVYAVIVLIVGLWVTSALTRIFVRTLKKRHVDENLIPVLRGMFNMIFKIVVVITVIGMLGIEATSFVAILGAAGFAVGMALSGTLGNFAGGIMILLFKPFVKGDFIEAQGYAGVVKEVQLFNTILTTGDNKTIIIPNGGLSTSSMVNYSTQETRRVDLTIGLGYGDDVDLARKTLMGYFEADSRILKDPEPFIALGDLADNSINLTVRVWVNAADYWGVYFETTERVYKEFPGLGLNFPYPQMDVHVVKEEL